MAQSVAGAPQAERAESRARKAETERPQKPRRTKDEYDTFVTTTDSPDAVRRLASNDQEEAHEDRQGQARPPAPKEERRRIDVQG